MLGRGEGADASAMSDGICRRQVQVTPFLLLDMALRRCNGLISRFHVQVHVLAGKHLLP